MESLPPVPDRIAPAGPDDAATRLWYTGNMQKAILIAVVVVAVAIIAWALWPGDREPPAETVPVEAAPTPDLEAPEPLEPTPVEAPAEIAPEPAPEPEPEVSLPPLTESDPFVRERLEPMSLPEPWLEQGDYVRRLAVVVENAVRGTYPRRQLAFLAPEGPFRVIERGEAIYIDPASYDRYDRHVEALEGVEPAQLAGLLDTIEPLLAAALGELGVEAPPGEMMQSALDEVMAVPVLSGDVELVQPNVMYLYADPDLEALSPLQKQVLRMGPDNVRRLQSHLREVAAALELDL
jgi:hypothetical protein